MRRGKKTEKKKHQGTRRLRRRFLYSLWIILVYRLGQLIPLPWTGGLHVQEAAGEGFLATVQHILGTNLQEASLLSLGLMPSMTAAIIVQMLTLGSGHQTRGFSAREKDRRVHALALVMSAVYAYVKIQGLGLVGTDDLSTLQVELLTWAGLTAGAMFVMWLGDRNAQNGLGGVSLLVATNIVTGIAQSLIQGEYAPGPGESYLPQGIMTVYLLLVIALCVFMDESQLRLPVLRAMIDSPMQGDSYLAIRLNPVGTIPVMYVMAFFTLPLYLIGFLRIFFPDSEALAFWSSRLNLNDPVGIVVFLVLFGLMNTGLASLYINPAEIEDDLKRAGDYLAGVRPGLPTRRHVRNRLRRLCLNSSLIMGAAIGVPLLYSCLGGEGPENIYFLPMTIAILTGIILGIMAEARVLGTFDAYRPRL